MGVFHVFLDCANGTKTRNASQLWKVYFSAQLSLPFEMVYKVDGQIYEVQSTLEIDGSIANQVGKILLENTFENLDETKRRVADIKTG